MKVSIYILCAAILFWSCSSSKKATQKTDATSEMPGYLQKQNVSGQNPLSNLLLVDAKKEELLGNYAKALSLFEQATVADSLNDAAYYEMTQIYLTEELNHPKQALKYIEKAVNIDPSNNNYQIIYGRLLVDLEEYDKGLAVLEKLVKENPKNKNYIFDLAFAYEVSGNTKKAISLYNDLEQKFGFDPEVNYQKHVLYFNSGQIEKGISEVEKLVEQFPDNTNYTALLAEYYYNNNQLDMASKYAQMAVNSGTTDPKTFAILFQSLAKQNKNNLLFENLNTMVDSDIDLDNKVQIAFPLIQMIKDKPELSKNISFVAEKLVTNYPNSAKVYALLGDVYAHNNQLAMANEAYIKSKEIDPTNYFVWEQVIYYYLEQNDYDEVAKIGKQTSDLFPDKTFPAYISGYANVLRKNYHLGILLLERALAMENIDLQQKIQAHALLGDSYYHINDLNQAFSHYDKALLLDPDNGYVLNNFSFYLAENGKELSRAIEMARRNAQLHPKDANTLDTFGYVLLKSGDFEQAVNVLEVAVNQIDDSAIVYEHYGDALMKIGKTNEALTQWQKALQLDPNNELLKSKVIKYAPQ